MNASANASRGESILNGLLITEATCLSPLTPFALEAFSYWKVWILPRTFVVMHPHTHLNTSHSGSETPLHWDRFQSCPIPPTVDLRTKQVAKWNLKFLERSGRKKKTEELLEIYGQEQVIFPVWGNDRPTMLWQEGITEYLTPTRCGVGVGGCTHRAECTFTCAGKNGTVFCLFRGQHSIHPGHEITI